MIERQKRVNLKPIPDLEIGIVDLKPEIVEAEVQPNSLHFRIVHKKGLKSHGKVFVWAGVLILLAFVSMSALLRFVPEFREGVILSVRDAAKNIQNEHVNQVLRPVLGVFSKALKAHRPLKAVVAAEPVTNSSGTCGAYITGAISKKIKTALADAEFLYLINCELFQDSPKFALQSLQKKNITLAIGTPWEGMPLSLLTLEANRRMAPLSPLPLFPKQSCLRWMPSSDCLMRYVDESRASFKSRWQDGFKALEKDISKQVPVVKAWFYFASSLYATKDREYTKANQYLHMASDHLGEEPNPYLEREIYRSGTINAFLSKDNALVSSALSLMPVKRVAEAPNAFLDTELLEQIRGKEGRSLLEAYLTQPEAAQRFAADPRFLAIILGQTQRFHLEPHGLNLASQVFGPKEKIRAEAIGEAMVLLYARMWIGADKSFDALEILTQLEKAGYRSAELYHLKGLAQLFSFKKPEVRLLAAKDFQTAASLSKNEESLFAMLIALLDAKDRSKANQVMLEWKKLGPSAQKSQWFGFAQGLISYTEGNKEVAQSSWDATELAHKSSSLWTTLRNNLASDPTYLDRDLAKTLGMLLGPDSPLGSLAVFGQKS